jgi:hypothetical protein
MPELGSFGSARGVPGNGHSYRKPRAFGASACSMHRVRCYSGAIELRKLEQNSYSIVKASIPKNPPPIYVCCLW